MYNIDSETGIRFGVINANDDNLFNWLYDDIQDVYQAFCPHCKEELDNGVDSCKHCGEEVTELDWSEEPIERYINNECFDAIVTEGMDLFVTKSKYKCYRGLCSPCAPGACYLKTEGNYECYCLPVNWYKVVPFDIYDLAGNLIAKKGTINDD
jgi:hypothetical protein